MVAILEKSEHNIDFHPMVDFAEVFPLRRNLKLQDEEGISSLPDTELFENLTLVGYNISPNKKLTFQKSQFFLQWKFLIHTIMRCLSPKSTGFNEFSRNIGLFPFLIQQGEGLGTPTEPHHTPSQEAQPSSHTYISSPSIPTVTSVPTIPIPTVIPFDTTPIRQYTQRARIAQSSALPPIADEPASPMKDVNQGEACPTDSSFIADQDRATIAKELKEQLAREDQRRAEQIARDAEIARIHAEEELQSIIEGSDNNNKIVAKYLEEYCQFSLELTMKRRIELISDLVKYQDNYTKVYKFHSQQRKSWTKKQKRDYYMAVIRNNLG
nr:hypothetical protein [Tanacetum cinerariifolium]